MKRSIGIRLALLLTLAPLFAGGAPHPVPMGSIDRLYGFQADDILFTFDHEQGTHLVKMAESDSAGPREETCFAAICYDPTGLHIGIFTQGEPKARAEECGGAISCYLRPGLSNGEMDEAPLSFRYSLEPLGETIPTAPDFCPFDNENRKMNEAPHPMRFDTLSYGNSHVRVLPIPPRPRFRPFARGWTLFFTFEWIDFHRALPFREGELPTPWRLILTRHRPDGSAATWGTIDAPVVLSFGRPGDPFIEKVQRSYLRSTRQIGKTYRSAAEFLRTKWSSYRSEQWMDHLELATETFEEGNPRSDGLFLSRCLEPVLEGNAKLDKAIYYNPKSGIGNPPFDSYPKSARASIIARLDDVLYLREKVEDIRRDYLLSRFLDEPIPEASYSTGPGQKKPPSPRSPGTATTRGLDLEEDEPIIDLDEEDF